MIFGKTKTMEKTNQLKIPITDIELIKKLLPHREPMIMVNTLAYFTEKKAGSTLLISEDNIFVSDGVFSEAGILEHMAQTAALHIGYKQSLKNNIIKEGFIGAIKSSHISELPKINETLSTEMEVVYEIETMTMVKINTLVNGNCIATSEMTTVLKED